MGILRNLRNLKNIYQIVQNIQNTLNALSGQNKGCLTWQFKQLQQRLQFSQRSTFLADKTLTSTQAGVVSDLYGEHEIIVSLTSYGRRVKSVYLTIESLMQQTMPANRIILWLSDEIQAKPLPKALQLQMRRGLEVRYCKDIRSYKKLIPALKAFPEATIITVDDDVLYDCDALENMIVPHLLNPKAIYANRMRWMEKSKNGKLESYREWKILQYKSDNPSRQHFATGVGGILYPPHALDPEVMNESVFMDICMHCDDVWFYAMAIKAGTPIIKTCTVAANGECYVENYQVADMGLWNRNIDPKNCGNDVAIKAVFEKYDIYNKI